MKRIIDFIKRTYLLFIVIIFMILFIWIIIRVIINLMYSPPEYTTYESILEGKILKIIMEGDRQIPWIRFSPDGENIIFIGTYCGGKTNYCLKKLNLKTKELKTIYTEIIDYNKGGVTIGNIFFINKNILLLFDERREDKDTYRTFEININKNFSIKKNESPINSELMKIEFQSQYNRNYFFWYGHASLITIIKYPYILKKFRVPEGLFKDNTSINFGRTIDEIIISSPDIKEKKRWIYFYNYQKNKIIKKIDMPLFISNAIHLLSPNSRYLLMFNIKKGLWILDLEKNELLDINSERFISNDLHIDDIDTGPIDWSWDSRRILFSLEDGIYIMDLDYLLSQCTRKTKVEVY